ncbi:B3 domain-containing transcription factor VAL3 [Raphanus sativus]|uniref:B3 domain-containing transcription factor VAL3 isoform X2 n=1 Tax=Raphanus sativus TaxID=3726 RepID=A0A6J0MFJ5_RAPSA|nr:B3 domain-containing transcription factor VAL3 isoform X2 [Raphanus sativus]KAJ4912819.1 B3 domain-containing transcription factor VAL3 [Raphanus sativus]
MLPFPSSSSSVMASSYPTRFCFNRECPDFNRHECYRPGWRLRNGDFADLCSRCASAYEQGKFCDIFHQRASGWRCCESCGKRIHCGCIVSASAFMLLDAGGIECLTCARKKVSVGPNFRPPPSFLYQSPIAEKFNDMSLDWSSSARSYRPPNLSGPSILQYNLHNRGDGYEFNQPTSRDKATAYSTEKQRGMNDLMGKLMSVNSNNHSSSILYNQKPGPNCKVPTCPNVNAYQPLISLKEGPLGTQRAFPVTTPIETNGHLGLDERYLWHKANSSPLSHLHNDLNSVAPLESKNLNFGIHLDTPGKYQVVPRYCPKVPYKNQVLQNLSNESVSVVTPLFEKILSVSDAGRVGRMVLPKKCAEAFLPQISQTDGVPLTVHDSTGKEWTFQFRFWFNNNSRMYFLEGVTPCIQSMQLQAGDTVIFSRVDPEKKLIMGFRKASVAQSSDQETGLNNNRESSTNGDAEPIDKHPPTEKKKSSMTTTRSKRQKVEKGDLSELKLTWEEAQGFILPPPNLTPSITTIEGIEFEEYEDAPVIGKPNTGLGSTYSANGRLSAEQDDEEAKDEAEGLLTSPKSTSKHPRHRNGCTCIVCIQSPSGASPKHGRRCSCTVCDTVRRRRETLLLRKKKQQIEIENKARKELESPNSDEELRQSANNSGTTSKNHEQRHAPPSKAQIDLNFQPERDEESLSPSNTTTKDKSPHHDETSCKPPSSSSVHSRHHHHKLHVDFADS